MSISRIVAVSKNSQIEQFLRKVAQEIFIADDHTEAIDIVNIANPDVIFYEYHTETHLCESSIETINRISSQAPVVAIYTDDKAKEFLTNNQHIDFHDSLHIGEGQFRLRQIIENLKKPQPESDTMKDLFVNEFAASVGMAGQSGAAIKTSTMIDLVAKSNCNPVLIVGETGTGKELVAKTVHLIRHPKQEFVAINCAALTANLLESELFGHCKGAFTGADKEKIGLLEVAGNGTIFLDEISEMPVELQAKLLRVLQEKIFRKVGGTKDILCKATIIASSNRELLAEVNANRFRRDLYYRLNICPISIPPLRAKERKDDIPLLADYFLATSNICPDKSSTIRSITKMALESLSEYHWPGNARELRNVMERAILLETTDKIGLSSIIFEADKINNISNESLNNHLKSFSIEKAEQELIAKALKETDWQKTRAASLLGITRATLYAKIKQYDIKKGIAEYKSKCESDAFSAMIA